MPSGSKERLMKCHKLIFLPLLVLLVMAPSGLAKAQCFVAIRNGNVRSGPSTKHKIIGNVQKWEVLEAKDYEVQENWIAIRRNCYGKPKKGYQVSATKLTPGELAIFCEDPSNPEKFEEGILVEYTGEGDIYDKGLEVHYKPKRICAKYIHKSIGDVVSGGKEDNEKRIANIKETRWPEDLKIELAKKNIRLDMTKDMVLAAWGKPNDINRTVTANGTREQWVYGSYGSRYKPKFLYFENGIMTAWQD
jgi:hypothetical protein